MLTTISSMVTGHRKLFGGLRSCPPLAPCCCCCCCCEPAMLLGPAAAAEPVLARLRMRARRLLVFLSQRVEEDEGKQVPTDLVWLQP